MSPEIPTTPEQAYAAIITDLATAITGLRAMQAKAAKKGKKKDARRLVAVAYGIELAGDLVSARLLAQVFDTFGEPAAEDQPDPTETDHVGVLLVTDELLTCDDVCALLRVSRRTLERWEAAGKLVPLRVGPRVTRYRRSDIDAFIAGGAA
jgi:excisionase family DNA binding protein